MSLTRSVVLLVIIFAIGCDADQKSHDAWVDEVGAWKQARVESLRQNWVSLAGLYWLDEGDLTFGSAASNDLTFPSRLPERMGTISLHGHEIRMEVEPGVAILHEEEVVESIQLIDDSSGEPTLVGIDEVEWFAIERDGRYAIRVYDRSRASELTLADLPFYPLDSAWNLAASFEPYDPVRTIPVPTVMGTLAEMIAPGKISFEVDGETYELDVLEGGTSRYFVMFADPTNRTDTYEAGRYVYIDHENEDGKTMIDFNRSYNPPCAFTAYATCPFPPPQNRIDVVIDAGEMRVDEERWTNS